MSKSLTIREQQKTDALSRIQRFMSNSESGVVLTAEEEMILTRLIYTNALLSERKYSSEQVIQKVKDKFGISQYTARADIEKTYILFSTVTEDYKRYTLKLHIEAIERKIVQWENDKSLAHLLPKLYAEKTRAIAELPVQLQLPDTPAPVIILDIKGSMSKPDITAEQARAEAEEILKHEDKDITDIDFEEVKKDE
jgi:hypothetical protein